MQIKVVSIYVPVCGASLALTCGKKTIEESMQESIPRHSNFDKIPYNPLHL